MSGFRKSVIYVSLFADVGCIIFGFIFPKALVSPNAFSSPSGVRGPN